MLVGDIHTCHVAHRRESRGHETERERQRHRRDAVTSTPVMSAPREVTAKSLRQRVESAWRREGARERGGRRVTEGHAAVR